MMRPLLVRQCLEAIHVKSGLPVSVKCRIGVDSDDYNFLHNFVGEVSEGGKGVVQHFIVHARQAILKGLSPGKNRKIPPLQYDRVYQLSKDFPNLKI